MRRVYPILTHECLLRHHVLRDKRMCNSEPALLANRQHLACAELDSVSPIKY